MNQEIIYDTIIEALIKHNNIIEPPLHLSKIELNNIYDPLSDLLRCETSLIAFKEKLEFTNPEYLEILNDLVNNSYVLAFDYIALDECCICYNVNKLYNFHNCCHSYCASCRRIYDENINCVCPMCRSN